MDAKKRKKLESAGWAVGSAAEFLGLSEAESRTMEIQLALSDTFAARRAAIGITQVEVADLLGSSQSRVAKMEAGDPSVSVDLLLRGLLVLGVTETQLADVLSGLRPEAVVSRPRVVERSPAADELSSGRDPGSCSRGGGVT